MARDLLGKRYGRLTVVRWVGQPGTRWTCRCKCGKRITVRAGNLNNGSTRSCGCLRDELLPYNSRTHGRSRTPEHRAWANMITRCENRHRAQYKDYGGRGIRVCARWRRSFSAFFADMGPRPSLRHSLDRFPNRNGDYRPSNCRWATRLQQGQNTRRNRILRFRGEALCRAAWARRIGIADTGIKWRLAHGWSLRRALTQAPQERRRSR